MKNKKILITGATSGIGKATAIAFAREGCNLIITGRRKERLETLAKELENAHKIEVVTLVFDVTKQQEVASSLTSLAPEWQKIDVLVNNAGKAKGLNGIHDANLDHWEEMIDTNLKGLLYVSRIVSEWMVNNRSGHIINVCSIAGKEVYPKGNVYCATKHAVDALTKGMRIDLHQFGIRVGQVCPGHVEETEFALVRFDQDAEKAKIYEDFQPLKSSDIANAIYFMASQPAHVNVQDMVIWGSQQANATIIDRSGR